MKEKNNADIRPYTAQNKLTDILSVFCGITPKTANIMTIQNKLERIQELTELKNEYLNMIDICNFADMLTLDNINAELFSLKTQLKYEIEYFTEETAHGVIIGYKRYNGYRIVNTYVRTLYAGRPLYTLDYLHARQYTNKQTAIAAYDRMIEYNNNNPGEL